MFDLSGMRFGRLTAVSPKRTPSGKYGWLCRCDCGNKLVVRTADLRNNHTRSCGCYQSDQCSTHGLSKTDPYDAWCSMVRRCTNPADKDYARYGARGIVVCDEWKSYETFFRWAMDNGYRKGLSLDRINNELGYSPDNCRFRTMAEQERNKTNNIHVVVNGVKMLLIEFSEKYHVPYQTAHWRYKNNRDLLSGKELENV